MSANNTSVGVNPTVETVLGEVTTQIKGACAPIPIDQDAIDDFLYTYTPLFARRLAVAVWDTEKGNVLTAAEQHGIIAKALATLGGATHVNVSVTRYAGTSREKTESYTVMLSKVGEKQLVCRVRLK